MSVLKLKRGSTAQVGAYTPEIGEPVYNSTLKRLVIGDGATAGGVDPVMTYPNLSALNGLTGVADRGFYFTGSGAMSLYTLSSLGRTLGGIANSAAGRAALLAAGSGANSDITSLTGLTTALSVGQGGTGGTTQATARSGIGAAASGANSDITSLTGITTPLTEAQGGTGVGTQTFASLTLQNSWAVIASRRAGYRKVVNDVVFLELQISGGTATDGTLLATLPVGFRPANQLAILVSSGPNTALSTTVQPPRVVVGTDGTITCQNCSTVAISCTATFSTT